MYLVWKFLNQPHKCKGVICIFSVLVKKFEFKGISCSHVFVVLNINYHPKNFKGVNKVKADKR